MRDPVQRRQIRRAGLFAAMFFLPACTPKTPPPAADTGPAAEPSTPPKLDLWAGVPAIEPEAGDITAELTPVPGPKLPVSVSEKVELPLEDVAARRGFGSELIEKVVPYELDGRGELNLEADGIRSVIEVPLSDQIRKVTIDGLGEDGPGQ